MACANISKNQTSNEVLICAICTDIKTDPRALLCGHSYCGPPKTCLEILQRPTGLLRCAICNAEHQLNLEDLKPLYGIREHLEEYSSQISAYQKEIGEHRQKIEKLQKSRLFEPPVCSNSICEKIIIFWCKDCEVEICDDCLEKDHDKHSVAAFEKNLRREVAKKLGKFSTSGKNKLSGK